MSKQGILRDLLNVYYCTLMSEDLIDLANGGEVT